MGKKKVKVVYQHDSKRGVCVVYCNSSLQQGPPVFR